MHKEAKEAFIKQLNILGSNLSDTSSLSSLEDRFIQKIASIGYNTVLIGSYADQYRKLCEQIIAKQGWHEKVSVEVVDDWIRDVIADFFVEHDEKKLLEVFDKSINAIEKSIEEQIVYMPLDNIEMDIEKLEIGKITLYKSNSEGFQNFLSKYDPKQVRYNILKDPKIERLRENVFAVFHCTADPTMAASLALQACRRVIDLLRYSIPSLYPNYYPTSWYPPLIRKEMMSSNEKKNRNYISVGLQGEVANGIREMFVFPPDSSLGFLWSIGREPLPLEISQKAVEIMEKIGVFRMANIFEKDEKNLTGFENVLLRGIHWFANAQVQFEAENELLSLTTCLETFLTGNNSEPIISTVADGTALIVGKTLQERKEIARRVKEIYKVRSRISHHGHKGVHNTDIVELRYIVLQLTKFLIDRLNDWSEHKELSDWIEEQKLG